MSRPPGSPHGRCGRILRAPLLHFVVIGIVLFVLLRAGDDPGRGPTIRISESDVAAIESEWILRMGRPPDEQTLDALLTARVDDELLLEEARLLGWNRTDAIVQRRLIRNQRFLTPDPSVSDAELLERAFEQGMDESDIVVRRRLLERMRLLIASGARTPPPTEAELTSWLNTHAEEYEEPPRVRLTHVFLSRDRRGPSLERDARALAAELRAEGTPPEAAQRRGDPFLLSTELPLWSESAIARQLGPDFASAAMQAPIRRWSDPIESSYGHHIVWVHETTPARRPGLDEVRRAVEADVQRERERVALREHLARLRARARIELAERKGGTQTP